MHHFGSVISVTSSPALSCQSCCKFFRRSSYLAAIASPTSPAVQLICRPNLAPPQQSSGFHPPFSGLQASLSLKATLNTRYNTLSRLCIRRVTSVPNLTAPNTDSNGFVVCKCTQCSTGSLKNSRTSPSPEPPSPRLQCDRRRSDRLRTRRATAPTPTAWALMTSP